MTEQGKKGMTYAGVGVDYDAMDPFKRQAQLAARETAKNIEGRGMKEVEASRGESAYLVERRDCYLAHVEEGLGTKNLVADAMYELTGRSYYDNIAQDTVAMIVNDMITLGALPVSTAMHLAVGGSEWFDKNLRRDALVYGWKKACDLSGCSWGGGETPTLKDIVAPGASVLSGSAMGIIEPKSRLIKGNIRAGLAIMLLESSGIHANGLTLARRIAEKLPRGYLTELSDGRNYGETLLDATHIYAPVIATCLERGVDICYAVNITGHGWRKLMRSPKPFAYVIEKLPPELPIFEFLQKLGPLDDEEAYGNLNMGAGFALYVPQEHAPRVVAAVKDCGQAQGLRVFQAGHIEDSNEPEVFIEPKGLKFSASTLAVR